MRAGGLNVMLSMSCLRQNAVGLAVRLQPAPGHDGRSVSSGRQFEARIERKKSRHLIFQNDPVLQEDHLLEMEQLLVRVGFVKHQDERVDIAEVFVTRLDEKTDEVPRILQDRTRLV